MSNLEFRNHIIVSSIKFRKGFAKFMIPIASFKKFLSLQFIASVEVSNIAGWDYSQNVPKSKHPLVKTSPNWSKRPHGKNVCQNVPKMIFYSIFYENLGIIWNV